MLAVDAETISLGGGELHFWPGFLSTEDSARCFARLRDETPWAQSQITIAGRTIPIPRLNAWYGDSGADYGYSGVRLETQPWTATLALIKARVEEVTGLAFNSALVNLYRDNRDSVDWHADDERELGVNPRVASVSLGETRRFELRRRDDHRCKFHLDLADGSLLLMAGALQHYWQHRLGKDRRPCGERINITFRSVHNEGDTVGLHSRQG